VNLHRLQIFRSLVLLVTALFLAGLAAQAQTPTTIWSFSDTNGDGAIPFAPVIFDSSGAIYGTTAIGGVGTFGTVFELTPPSGNGNWTENILYHFVGGIDGQQPSDIVFGSGGVIYSTTSFGGSDLCYQGCGTIFQLTPPQNGGSWTKQTLYYFTGGQDGQAPGNVLVGANGTLFGTTTGGGPPAGNCHKVGCGTVWDLTESNGVWTKTFIHTFPGATGDGDGPNYDIVFDANGNLYGTTYYGGNSNYGTVFKLSPPAVAGGEWTETILHSFTGSSTDGGYPIGGLVIAPNGVVYGTASYSGVANNSGTAFELTPPVKSAGTWTYRVIHKFAGGNDGATPATTMALDQKGNLYGTTWNGGSAACYLGCGTIFELTPPTPGGAWTETILHDWANSGQDPDGSIVVFHDETLYGTSEFFGTSNDGTVFTMTP
jgi:uncharacterized repeat protein (TIGR03803 family)